MTNPSISLSSFYTQTKLAELAARVLPSLWLLVHPQIFYHHKGVFISTMICHKGGRGQAPPYRWMTVAARFILAC